MQRILLLAEGTRFYHDLSAAAATRSLDWDIVLATTPDAAWQAMSEQSFDAAICGERLRGFSGQQILNEVARRHPDVVRILLAGAEESQIALGTLASSHHVLAAPCNIEALSNILERAQSLRSLLNSSVVIGVVSRLKKLPSYPAVYAELSALLEQNTFAIAQVSAIVRRDASMVAKVLQLANSAYFGFSRTVSNIDLAVSLLGVQMIRNLVLANEVFCQFESQELAEFRIDKLWEHSLRVSTWSSKFARDLSLSRRLCDDAFAAGILHDVGKLALIANLPQEYRRVRELISLQCAADHIAEQEVFGAGHAELGAFLLGLWGLPENIVEAVAYHHQPLQCPNQGPAVLSAVYFANYLEKRRSDPALAIDHNEAELYAARLGIQDQVLRWSRYLEEQGEGFSAAL